jgi:hypothetical protein
MRRRYADDRRLLYKGPPPGLGRPLLIVFGVALLLGLGTGLVWIAWNLLRLHVLP